MHAFRRFLPRLLAAAVLALPAPGMASKSYTCTSSTQECLDEMVSSLEKRGWVGLEMDQDEESGRLTVRKIVAGSPAEAAGFKPGDVLTALNGLRMDDEKNAAGLKKARESMLPGVTVEYTVLRSGKDVLLRVTLGSLPSDVLAQWVGMHMLEHVTASVEPPEPPK